MARQAHRPGCPDADAVLYDRSWSQVADELRAISEPKGSSAHARGGMLTEDFWYRATKGHLGPSLCKDASGGHLSQVVARLSLWDVRGRRSGLMTSTVHLAASRW
jgi:hypothetical protein